METQVKKGGRMILVEAAEGSRPEPEPAPPEAVRLHCSAILELNCILFGWQLGLGSCMDQTSHVFVRIVFYDGRLES